MGIHFNKRIRLLKFINVWEVSAIPHGYSINIMIIELCSLQEDIRQTCHLKSSECILNNLKLKDKTLAFFALASLANSFEMLGA